MKKSTKNLLLLGAAVGAGYYLYKKHKAKTVLVSTAMVPQQVVPMMTVPPAQAARMTPSTPDDDLELADEWVWGPSTIYGGSWGGGGWGGGHHHGGGHHGGGHHGGGGHHH